MTSGSTEPRTARVGARLLAAAIFATAAVSGRAVAADGPAPGLGVADHPPEGLDASIAAGIPLPGKLQSPVHVDLPPLPDPAAASIPPPIPPRIVVDDVNQAACSTCGGVGEVPSPVGGALACTSCGGSGCIPGRKKNSGLHYHTFIGRFFGNLYECLCCPDPCYEPSWVPAANAAFFQDFARPRTMQRFRWDRLVDIPFPDRAEYFWARENVGKGGSGPGQPQRIRNSKRWTGELAMSFDQFSFYQEAATQRASFFVEIPYRSTNPVVTDRHAGFADMNFGTKALFFDCELVQLTFQFRTFMPIGNARNGLGVGHISLEPSLLGSLKLSRSTYLQAQLAEWIPIGGDPTYMGSILHYHASLNQVLCRLTPDFPVIGTFELNGWSVQHGAFTDPWFAKQPAVYAGGESILNIGPGLRGSVCDRVDFGGAFSFAITDPQWASSWFRLELRILY